MGGRAGYANWQQNVAFESNKGNIYIIGENFPRYNEQGKLVMMNSKLHVTQEGTQVSHFGNLKFARGEV